MTPPAGGGAEFLPPGCVGVTSAPRLPADWTSRDRCARCSYRWVPTWGPCGFQECGRCGHTRAYGDRDVAIAEADRLDALRAAAAEAATNRAEAVARNREHRRPAPAAAGKQSEPVRPRQLRQIDQFAGEPIAVFAGARAKPGKRGKRGQRGQLSARDTDIVRRRDAGESTEAVAAVYGITPSRVSQITTAARLRQQ